MNRSYNYLEIKLNFFKREQDLEMKEVRMKYNEEIKKLREKLRKKTIIGRE
jgi:hypothetical protein